MTPWLGPLIAFVTASGVLGLLLGTTMRNRVLDRPNHRSLHHSPIPRTGGLAVSAGILAGCLIIGQFGILLVCLVTLVAISLLDDLKGLPQWIRFAVHLCAATAIVMTGQQEFGLLLGICLVAAIAWMTNLFNFMDGSDGLAGGMAAIGFSFCAVAAWNAHDIDLTMLSLAVVASTLPFLALNFSPARIFLGDAGSIPLGFLAGAIGLMGWRRGDWAACFPVLVFSPFIVDATITLVSRVIRRERFWLPHREHYYQRLIRMGWSHRKTALTEYFIMLAMGLMALSTSPKAEDPPSTLVVAAAVVTYAALAFFVNRTWHKQEIRDKP